MEQVQQQTVEKVRYLMRVRGTSVERMAREMGMTRANLHNYFRADKPAHITLPILERMAKVLDVPTWLLMMDRQTVLTWLAENPEYGSPPGDISLRRQCLLGHELEPAYS